ncbi:MAG: phospho-N-acetylmuramoyl-pentapeptide-transferase, partial [Treponema sp.]|nr:phospho-N-acetylmuramoyl-pentapeptide-transferase [Treponema sp.]
VPLDWEKSAILILIWLMMMTGFLDDASKTSWGEYRKAVLDLLLSVAASVVVAIYLKGSSGDGKIYFWLPFIADKIAIAPWLFIIISTIVLWTSVNTTNCTDGVDGLSSTLVLVALITLGSVFYFILGHKDIAAYLLVPHISDGAAWAVMTFCLSGVLMGYLWHNAYPSHVLMGDAGSRALGFFIGIGVMVSGNPFLILATSSVIFINGGMGLVKVALKRFLHISFFPNVRFPLHDHMRKNHDWSPTQVLLKFMMIQILVMLAILGVIFKIR